MQNRIKNILQQRPALPGLAVILFLFVVYLPNWNTWFQGDDFEWLNQVYAGWKNPAVLFELINNFFRPVVKVLYLVNYTFFGTEALYYNLVTLLIHLVNVYLLYYLIVKVTKRQVFSSFIALTYGVSAMYSESTLWSAGRPESMVMTFMLAAIIPFSQLDRDRETKLPGRATGMILLFTFLALGTKETWILLPFLAVSFTWIVQGVSLKQSLRVTMSLFIVLVLYLGLFVGVPMITGTAPFTNYAGVGLGEGIRKFGFLMFKYIGLGNEFSGAVWQYFLILLILVFVVYRFFRTKNKLGLWGLVWMMATIGITLPIYHAPGRYNYLPLMGFWIVVIAFIDYELKWLGQHIKLKKSLSMGILCLLLVFYVAHQVIMLQWEIQDYNLRGSKHKELADMYLKVKNQVRVDRPVIFVDLGERKAVWEMSQEIRGYSKILFVRESAIWQQVYFAPLANFLGSPFTRVLETVPGNELERVLKGDFTVLVFTDQGFFISEVYREKVLDFYRRYGKLPFKVQALRFVSTDEVKVAQ